MAVRRSHCSQRGGGPAGSVPASTSRVRCLAFMAAPPYLRRRRMVTTAPAISSPAGISQQEGQAQRGHHPPPGWSAGPPPGLWESMRISLDCPVREAAHPHQEIAVARDAGGNWPRCPCWRTRSRSPLPPGVLGLRIDRQVKGDRPDPPPPSRWWSSHSLQLCCTQSRRWSAGGSAVTPSVGVIRMPWAIWTSTGTLDVMPSRAVLTEGWA